MIDRLNRALEGRYRLERELGAGGMAMVYLAEDIRHRRKVALKVLKPELAAVVGAERFLAEIETTAALQHPHILPLFDSGDADGFVFYVMPYVDGESLRERLDREKQLPVNEAVRIALETADALDYAHRQGVIHRDVKPANILLHEGRPLIADFGIALAVQQAGGGRLTETGMSLGTPYYMSPEQATGDQAVDSRSDVYSLGCVLYEMLTGEPPYTGKTAQAVLGRILTGEAARPSDIRKSVPPAVEAAILHALEKLPADRPESASRFAAELSGEAAPGIEHGGRGLRFRRGGAQRGRPLGWVALAGIVAALAAMLAWNLAPGGATSGDEPVIRAVLELPANSWLENAWLALSPDGRTLVLPARIDGERMLLRRSLDAFGFHPIAGTEDASNPTISPDGRWIAFTSSAGLARVPVQGGGAVTIDSASAWGGAAWDSNGSLVYTRDYMSGLWRVGVEGGTPEMLTRPDTANGELGHWWPQLLPDGEHILFTAMKTPIENATIAVLSLQTGEYETILEGGVFGRYVATGHLLYAANEVLFAVPFDVEDLQITGPAIPVLDGIAMDHAEAGAAVDVSPNGTLVYAPAEEYNSPTDVVWVDRAGVESPILPAPGRYQEVAIAPEGTRLALTVAERGRPPDIWVHDLRRGTRTQITSGGGAEFGPLWTTDGQQVFFVSEQPVFDLYLAPADARSPAEPLVRSRIDKFPHSFTPDGDTLLYTAGYLGSVIRRISRADRTSGDSILVPGRYVGGPVVSPNGRWLAYISAESGREEVYLVSYRDPTGARRVVSTDGGLSPSWTKDGSEIVFRNDDGIFAVAVDSDSGELGQPELLFRGPYVYSKLGNVKAYDVTPDGERFAMVKRPLERAPRRVVVVTNFLQELRTRTEERRQ